MTQLTKTISIVAKTSGDGDGLIQYTLSIQASSGGTTLPAPGSHLYDAYTNAPITESPNAGYHFDHWILDGTDMGSNQTISVTMDKDHLLTALFIQNTCATGYHWDATQNACVPDIAGNTIVSGTVVNQYFPMPFITINFYDANQALVASPTTSFSGTFEITLPQGTYTIEVFNPLIIDFTTTIVLDQPTKELKIGLELTTLALAGIIAGATSPIWLYAIYRLAK